MTKRSPTRGASDAAGVLRDAEELVLRGARRSSYGPPVEAMRRVARAWSEAEGRDVTARDVALRLVALKLAREAHRHQRDNIVDAAGYLLIAALCADAEEAGR